MDAEQSSSPIDDIARSDAPQRDMSRHTLTIKQAADLFASLGVPRSPRSVQRFCELKHVDCIRVQGERTERYFIDPLSVERYAKELKQLESISQLGNDIPRHDASLHDVTRHDATPITPSVIANPAREPDYETEKLRERVDVLEKENLQLQIDRSAKEQVIGHMVDERRGFMEIITTQSHKIGSLETHVQQLEAPKHDAARHDAIEDIAETMASTEEGRGVPIIEQPMPVVAEPTKRKSWWRR
jgi:hypothetical protein